MKKIPVIILFLFQISLAVFSQTKDSLILFKDTINNFQFKYHQNYVLNIDNKGNIQLRIKTDDSVNYKIKFSVQKYNTNKETVSFSDFVNRISYDIFSSENQDWDIRGESINTIKNSKNKFGTDFIEIFENIDCSIYENGQVNHFYYVQGPAYFIDLSATNTAVIIIPCIKDMCATYNDKETIEMLKQIVDSFE